ncbi:MAG TPA: membrane protein insertase YidC [Thermoanaerobaculia bacterium]|nr:membrane protein insertase YidC [Thermoanaerobaculia bacterium]
MDNRRLLLAASLSFALIVVWTMFIAPKPPAKLPGLPAGAETPAATAPGTPAPSSPTATPAGPAAGVPAAVPPVPPMPPISAEKEEPVTLQAGSAQAVFSNRGAQLVSFLVADKAGQKTQLDLVRKRLDGFYPFGLTDAAHAPHPLNKALFAAEKANDGKSVVFRFSGSEGAAEKTFRFDDRGLLEVTIKLPGQKGWGLILGPGIRNPTKDELKSRFEARSAVYKAEDVKVLDPQRFDTVDLPGSSLRWIGVEDTWFLAAAIPEKGVERASVEPFLVQGGDGQGARFLPVPAKDAITSEQKEMPRELRVELTSAGDEMALRSYWGPKSYEKLKALPYGLEETVNWGMLRLLVGPLLAGIHWLHDNVVSNYGWAIVLMTVLIKLALLPLTHHSMKSMKKMQLLNPKMQAIRTRYATKLKDKQGRPNLEMQRKMNDEMMALYKEHGVNPAGGCLPMLLQMPILYAFYRLLSTAFELRGAPWILWITDLAAADPHYVLPIVMGATQFLQVKLSPQTGDPMQRRMFMLMPLFMTILFVGFPSGLVLYWLTNNVLTILQQWVYNRLQQQSA